MLNLKLAIHCLFIRTYYIAIGKFLRYKIFKGGSLSQINFEDGHVVIIDDHEVIIDVIVMEQVFSTWLKF